LLLVGSGGALRSSELVALDFADVEETDTGLLVKIRGSKTDQERAGATIAIARGDVACPAKALREWLEAAGIEAGPIFRPIDKAARCGPRGLPIDPSPTSSKLMPSAPASTPAHSQAIPCGLAS
jgi:hypothetical protein